LCARQLRRPPAQARHRDSLGAAAGCGARVSARRNLDSGATACRGAITVRSRRGQDRRMKALARLGAASVALTYLHLVFGGIVRISGSGMGCGDHWPRCNGSWIPPFNDATVMIEYTHRLLALLVVLA